MGELFGCFNKSADLVRRKDETWSDTNLYGEFNDKHTFKRLKCRNCNGLKFEVLSIGSYETAAKCCGCGMYYLVHCG